MIDSVTLNTDGLRICSPIKRDDGKSNLSGFFNDDGLRGMMEAAVFKHIYRISPFLAALVDRCCDEYTTIPVTDVFCSYVELLQSLENFTQYSRPIVTHELSQIVKKIQNFKKRAVQVFVKYQKSGMGTLKWHLLDHTCDDINRLGSFVVCDAGVFEESTNFSKQYTVRIEINVKQQL